MAQLPFLVWHNLTKLVEGTVEVVQGLNPLKKKTKITPGQGTDAAEIHRQQLANAKANAAKAKVDAVMDQKTQGVTEAAVYAYAGPGTTVQKGTNAAKAAAAAAAAAARVKVNQAAKMATSTRAAKRGTQKAALGIVKKAKTKSVSARFQRGSAFGAVKKALDKATGKAPPKSKVALRF